MSNVQCTDEACTPGSSARAAEGTGQFHELLELLRDCHANAVQELQLKVNKLKKERCSDAQRLEEFYKKNQHLREQQKTLQESIKVLKERLQSGPCDRCRETEKQMKKTQAAFENLPLLNELQTERNMLKEENRKLSLQLERLRGQICQQTSFSEPEEGVIPDSPKQPLSFPVVNKMMKRKRDQSHVRYAEKLLPLPDPQKRELTTSLGFETGAVLVPETCDMDVTCISKSNTKTHGRTVVSESCHIDLNSEQIPVSDVNSESFLCEPKHTAKNFTSCSGTDEQNKGKNHDDTKSSQKQSGKHSEQVNIQDSCKRRSWETEQTKPDGPCTSPHTPCMSPLPSLDCSPNDESWSMDPGAALSQYDTNVFPHPEPKIQTETVDMDCTYVSHSLLIAQRKERKLDQANITGIGQKANDSLANIFDTTGQEDYESCPQDETSALEKENVPENEEEECQEQYEDIKQDEQMEEDGEEAQFMDEEDPTGDPAQSAKNTSVACVLVVRKKAERRKLQGHTCKECEIYYADLPEEERRKKLTSCSRHRFRYIPPSTPENFWDVGFPSTQTCMERGYIKEDNEADPRLRRRRPYLATFSPKVL
ncbi:DNA endonuclease RBBP8 isoform X2 [Hemibagrus wyckioides]|uniref:DNA endonuclease RBBP8 isoform X2 n=1 Tax=Hemibagrus wyckioides TaxID=337641 RepID=UPI00266BF7DB|nr:DNA endonuclease RBBP8 isoform X2 [Hemibagrus wyckioides]